MRKRVAVVLCAGLLGVSSAETGTLPAGFGETIVFSGLTQPTAVKFASDGRVFVAEKSGLIKVFDSLDGHDADGLRRPPDATCTTSGTAACSAWRCTRTSRRRRTSTCSTRSTRRSAAPPRRWGTAGVDSRRLPDPAGRDRRRLRRERRGSRASPARGNAMTGTRAGADRGLVPAVPEPLDRQRSAFGADGALYVSGGDGASFNFADYGQDGSPLNPCGDPPARRRAARRRRRPPRAARCAARTCATTGDPVTLDGAILRLDPTTGAALPDNPLAGSADAERRAASSPTACATRSASTLRPGHERALGRRRRLERVGGDQPHRRHRRRRGRELRLAVLRGRRPPGRLRRGRTSRICETLYAAPGAATGPFFTYNHAAKVVPGETCPTGSSSITGLAFYHGGDLPAAVRRRALLRRLHPRLHLGDAAGRERRARPAAAASPSSAGAANPVDLADRPRRRPLLRRLRRRHDPPHPAIRRDRAAGRRATPTRPAAPAPLVGAVRRHRARATRIRATRSPTPGTSTATARFDDSTAVGAQRTTYTAAGTLHGPAARHRPAGRSPTDHRHRSPSATRRPRPRSRLPRRALTWHVGRRDLLLRLGDRPGAGHAAGLGPDVDARACSTARPTATSTRSSRSRASRAARSRRPTTSTRPTSSCG